MPGPVPEPQPDNPASIIVVIVMLFSAIGVVVLAVVGRVRRRGAVAAAAAEVPDWLRRDAGRSTWRAALIAFAVIIAWLALAAWLGRLSGGPAVAPPALDQPGRTANGSENPTQAVPPVDNPTPPDSDGTDLSGWFVAATVVFLLVLTVGSIIERRRAPRPAAPGLAAPAPAKQDTDDESENLARAAELGLAEVEDPDREPRKAIIACYAAMEREFARTPDAAPREFDTASEVLARAVDHHALRPGTATRLVDLFDEARFSPHVMNEGHRETAVNVLTDVLAEMRSRP